MPSCYNSVSDDGHSVPKTLPPSGFEVIQVPQNGRCFLTCAFLFTKADSAIFKAWKSCLKSNSSMPIDLRSGFTWVQRLKKEEVCALPLTIYYAFFLSYYYPVMILFIYIYTHTSIYIHTTREWFCVCVCAICVA